jgi:hypothetical protein
MSAKTMIGRTVLIIGLLAMTGCANMDSQEQSMLSGAAAGTAVGAISTVMLGGCVACGAAIGGVVGTGAGYLIDQVNNQGNKAPSK